MITSRNKAFFLIFKNNFCSSWSAAEFWAVVADIIARVLNRPGTVLDVVLHASNAFESFTLLDKRKSYRISDRVFGLVSSLLSIFCYLSYIDIFVHYLIRFCIIDMFVWMKMFQQWHIHCTRKVASDISIYGNYFLQYFWSNFLGPNLWYWSSFCSIFRHYHFSNNYCCLYI